MTGLRPLIRHFLGSFVGRGVLEDEGIESVRTLFFSIAAMLFTIGLFLPRRFARLYMELGAHWSPEPYRTALVADGIFLFSLIFLVTVFVAALVAPAMFPDETDYVALIPLPLSKRRFFAAKFVALVIFGAGLLLTLTVMTSLAFPAFSHGQWAQASLTARIVAHGAGALASGTVGFALVMGLQGLILTTMPHRWLTRASVMLQCACVGGVILAAPLALQFVGMRQWVATEPDQLQWLPTAWTMGIEQVVLGTATPYWTRMAWLGVLALAIVTIVSLGSYALMYKHCERLILPPPPDRMGDEAEGRTVTSTGVRAFIGATLVRNRLPLLLLLSFMACAVGFMATEMLDWSRRLDQPLNRVAQFRHDMTAVRLPLVLMLLGLAGLRMAFLVPVLSRANWIFRTTDRPSARRRHLAVVERVLLFWIVLPALAVGAPFQALARGWSAVPMLLLTATAGVLMIEIALAGWRRIPFTCSWIPAQRPLVFVLIASGAALLVVSGFLPAMIVAASRSPWGFLWVVGLMGGTAGLMRWHRVRTWADRPLLFEDEVYDKLQTLGLSR